MQPATDGPCARCGQPHLTKTGGPSCTGHHKSTGESCKSSPVHGLKVCRMHGGSTKAAKAKAEQEIARQKASAAVTTYGLPVETTPEKALLDEIHRTAGHIAYLAVKVAELTDDDLIWGKTKKKTGGEDRGLTEEAKPHMWLVLYREERTHLVNVCAKALAAGVAERQIKLAEQQGQLVAAAIRAILDRLNLSPEQQAAAPEIVSGELRAISGDRAA